MRPFWIFFSNFLLDDHTTKSKNKCPIHSGNRSGILESIRNKKKHNCVNTLIIVGNLEQTNIHTFKYAFKVSFYNIKKNI